MRYALYDVTEQEDHKVFTGGVSAYNLWYVKGVVNGVSRSDIVTVLDVRTH